MSTHVAVDESMVLFKGKSSATIAAPCKPIKKGFKIFTMCDSKTKHMNNFSVYIRKKGEKGLTKKAVMDLCKPIFFTNRVIYVDKFHTSIPLALHLLQKDLYICGSFDIRRKHWPETLKDKTLKNLERGEHKALSSEDNTLLATVWKDSTLVSNLTTAFGNETSSTKRRNKQKRHVKEDVSAPLALVEFGKHMGG